MVRTLLKALIGMNSDLKETEERTDHLITMTDAASKWRMIYLPLSAKTRERLQRIYEKHKLTP